MKEPFLKVKDITKVPYKKLKDMKIKTIFFDFDETILSNGEEVIREKFIITLKKISNDFKIIIVTNSLFKSRIKKYISDYPIVVRALKPFSKGFDKALKIANSLPCEVALIGDKFFTDIVGGNKKGFYTILVEPLNKDAYSFVYKLYSKILGRRYL